MQDKVYEKLREIKWKIGRELNTMSNNQNTSSKFLRYTFMTFMIFVGFISIVATGGGGGGDSSSTPTNGGGGGGSTTPTNSGNTNFSVSFDASVAPLISTWYWRTPTPYGNRIYNTISAEGIFVSVGAKGMIFSSSNIDFDNIVFNFSGTFEDAN